jgi:hypothetical protein
MSKKIDEAELAAPSEICQGNEKNGAAKATMNYLETWRVLA